MMEKKVKLNILGTRPNVQNSQLLVSSGIPALDNFLLGGGFPVGTVIVIDEDLHGSYAKILLKYFLAEGIVNKHAAFVASLDCNPKCDIIEELPAVNSVDVEQETKQIDHDMKIAFRYKNLPTADKQLKPAFGHYYDLSKHMKEELSNANITYFNGSEDPAEQNVIETNIYNNLICKITDIVKEERFILDNKFDVKNILRVAIHHLGSPMWESKSDFRDLRSFLLHLKCLMRKCFGVALITVPTHLGNKLKSVYDKRIVHISDIAIRLEAFAGTKHERNKSLSEYHGFFHLVKLAAINCLVSQHPGSVEYTFKLRKKKFCIEKLHLPPDIQDASDDTKKHEKPTLGCGSSGKHLLEF